jgi:Arc/MetJ family transcription regulator
MKRSVDRDIAMGPTDIMARTVINLRDDLIARARRLTGLRRKVEIVNAALEAFVEQHEAYRGLRALRGKVRFRAPSSVLLRERHGFSSIARPGSTCCRGGPRRRRSG